MLVTIKVKVCYIPAFPVFPNFARVLFLLLVSFLFANSFTAGGGAEDAAACFSGGITAIGGNSGEVGINFTESGNSVLSHYWSTGCNTISLQMHVAATVYIYLNFNNYHVRIVNRM